MQKVDLGGVGRAYIYIYMIPVRGSLPPPPVFLLEVQYSILKSLISTCVLSYVGSREDWLLDRISES